MQNIKISFIIPVYNLEQLLSRCLESLINQTLSDLEIIVIDDGSTDNSRQIINNYAMQDSRISTFFLMHVGVSSVRNFGISQAKGEYIGFVDGDDFLAENFAQEMYNNIKDNQSILCCCGVTKIHSTRGYKEQFIPKQTAVTMQFFGQNPNIRNPVWNKLYDTALIKKYAVSFTPNSLFAEDYAFTILYYLLNHHSGTISYVKTALYNYWRHDTSIMSNLHLNLSEKIHDIVSLQTKYLYCIISFSL